MSIIGKIHEISFYGLLTTILCLFTNKVSIVMLWEAAFHPNSLHMVFQSYLFWASVLFVPIAIIAAFMTKYRDNGEGLTFTSENVFVIIFAHIAEELLGLLLTPPWFFKDMFLKNFNKWKVIDYTMYTAELVFITIGIVAM